MTPPSDRFGVSTKLGAIHLAGCTPGCRRHVVIADIAGGWTAPLLSAGFDHHARTLWLAEGLFFYLAEPAITRLLRGTAHISGPGSLFAADVVGATGLDSPMMQPYRAWCDRNGVAPPFGTDDPVSLFAADGWQLAYVTAPGAPDANYGRLHPQPSGVLPGRTHLVTGHPPCGTSPQRKW